MKKSSRTRFSEYPQSEDIEVDIEDVEVPAEPPKDLRTLRLLNRQTHTFMGRNVVVMVDERGEGFLVDPQLVDLKTTDPQLVDVTAAFRPYAWDSELDQLFPSVEYVRQVTRESFWRAGAFDREALQTAVKNSMFDTAFPYRRLFFTE